MKAIFIILFVFIVYSSKAQFTKNDVLIGGDISLIKQDGFNNPNFQTNLSNDLSNISVSGKIGMFVNEKIVIGGLLQGALTIYDNINNSGKYESKSIAVGAFHQHYFNIAEKILFSISSDIKFERGKEIIPFYNPSIGTVDNQVNNVYAIASQITPKLTFLPSKKWGIDASFGSVRYTYTHSLSYNENASLLQFDFAKFSFGLSYFIRQNNE